MPESAKGQNKSYKDYIMGTGYDMVEKTAEWAAPICGISADASGSWLPRSARPSRCTSFRAGARSAAATAS